MKYIIFALLLVPFLLKGQSCNYYFNLDKGDKLIYHHLDKKDKLSSVTAYEFVSKTQQNDKLQATLNTVIKDKKDKLITEAQMELTCEDGNLFVDMKSYINPEMMETYQEMDMTMTGDKLGFPGKMHVGDELNDGSIKITVQSGGMTMANITITITNRKVEAKEDIQTPAGTFSCYKISSTTKTDMMITMETKSVEWFAPEIGLVKSETYDKRGNKTATTLLQEVRQ
ncbi:MAG: hypothetical protein GVY19_06890 [Bacteroidetes bacterium]|jgi:hypothetical protein|nr:hypothetical protein [Bacteroidota bacterium]